MGPSAIGGGLFRGAWAHPVGPVRLCAAGFVVVRAFVAPASRGCRGRGGIAHEVYAMVINATDACTLHVHYIVHILHNTLLPVGCVLTQRGIIAITIRVRADRPSTLSAYRSAVYSQDQA